MTPSKRLPWLVFAFLSLCTLWASAIGAARITSPGTPPPVSGAALQWVPSGLSGLGVNSLAINPGNTNIIYATVGEGTSGWGTYKSSNAGASWPLRNDSGLPHYAVAINPTLTTTVYAGVYTGILKTTTAGSSWNSSLNIFASVWALAIDPTNTTTVYAGLDSGDGVYTTTDSGANWTNPLPDYDVRALAVNSVNTNVIYAGTRDYAATVGGVLKTVNSGITWTQVMSDSQVNALAINPVTRTVVYAGTDGAGVYKSADGGANWSPVNAGLTIYTIVRALAVDPSNPNVVYAGTFEGGVFRSTDGGMSWSAINSGLTNLNILSLAIDPSNTSVVYAGTQGDGVFKLTSNNVTPSPTSTSTVTPTPSITPTPTAISTATPTPTATSLGLPVKNLFLPLALRDFIAYFEGPFEVEDNDSYLQANGPLRSGRDYFGYPDDAKDYFSIVPLNAGTITINLSNHTGTGVQLQLFYQSVTNVVAYDLDPPYQIVYSGAAGTYYIYLFTESGFNSTTPYNLRVTFP